MIVGFGRGKGCRWTALLFVLILSLAASGRGDAGKAYLAADVVPFATDRTENLLLSGTSAVLTIFFRYKQELISEREMEIDRATFLRVGAALKEVDAGGVPGEGRELGEDMLVFYVGIDPTARQTTFVPSARTPSELLVLLQDLRSKGSLHRDVSQNRIRSIPFIPVGEKPPKSVAEKDFSREAWQTLKRSIDAPMHFIALDETTYRFLLSELIGQRQLVVLNGGQYFELRLYEAGTSESGAE